MTSRKAYLLGLLSLLFLPTQSPGQVGYTTDEMVTGDASGTLYSAVVPLAFPRSYIFARGDFGDRPGVLDNYFSTGGFMPMQFHGPDEVFYIEGQVWLTEQNEKSLVGGNFGVGNRWLIRDYSQMIGVNAFFAWDQKGSGFNYDGVGVGAEWLSDYLGVTVNGYIPWNRRINALGPATPIKELTHFTGNNLAFVTLQPVEEQLAGGDIEIGSAIPRAEWLSLFAGAYAFDADQGNDFTGISGRAQLDFTSAIVNIGVYDDDRFGTSVNVTGELRLGDGPLDFTPRHRTLDNQMFDRARRQARIQTLRYIAEGEELAINPANGLPFEFIHVDNTAGPGGDGSFEMRFDELDDASNMPTADIILAYRGDTSFGGTHLDANGGLVLEDNQIVVGEGYPFLLETANFPGLLCPLPDFGDGGTNPFIDGNAGADLITLANNNQILGLNLLAPTGGNAIVGTDITDTVIDEINRDVIFGVENTGDGGGILLTNIGGTADITNIGFEITDPASAGGIIIDNTNTADLTLNINNDLVEFPGLVVMGGQTGIGISADNSNITADIDNINNSESETGIAFVGRNAADITAIVDNSDFTNSTGDGLNVDLDDASTGTAMFTDGSFADSGDGAGDHAIDILLAGGSDFDLVLDNTSGNNAFDDGIFGSIDDGSDLMIVATDSTFSGAQTGDGLDIDAFMGSTFNGSFTDGSFADAGGNGATLDFDGMGTTGVLTLDNVPLDNAGLNALEVIADNSAVVTVTGDEVSGAGAGADGINLNADNTAMIGVMLTNTGSFAGANDDGVDLTNANGGFIALNATGDMAMPVDFSGVTTGNGLVSTATGANTRTDIDFGTGANFDNSAIDAINITSNTGAVTTLDGTDISGDSAGDDGIQLSSNGGMIGVTITEAGSFANAGQAGGGTGDGIDIFNENGGQIVVNLSGDAAGIIDFSGAERHGLVSDTDGNGTATTINLNTGAMFDNAGEDAINLTSTNMGFTQLTGTMVSGSSAGDDGIDLNNDGGMINLQLTNTGSFADAGQALGGTGDGIDSENINGGITAINIAGAGGMPVDFSGAERDGLFALTGLNATTDIDFNTGAMFDNAGNHAIHLEANDAASVTLDGDNVSGSMAGSDAILINAENSAGVMSTGVDVNLTNTGSFAGAGGDGLEFNGTDSADLNINISGTAMTPADFSGAAGGGVNGFLDDSMAILTLTNTNFNGPLGGDGMNIDANNGSIFAGNISDSTFNDATVGDGIEVNIDGSMGTLNLTNVDANNAFDNALMLRADDTMAIGSSILDVNLNTVNLNDAGGDAINAIAMDGGFIDIDGTDVNGMDAGDMGVQLSADASRIDFTLNSTGTNDFTNSGDSGLVFVGTNTALINVNVSDTNFDDTVPGGFGINGSLTDSTATLNLTDVTANNAEFAGLRVRADNSTVSGTLSNVELNDAGTDAVFIQGLAGADIDFTMTDISGLNAGDDGFDIIATGVDAMTMTDINIQIDDSDFSDAANNGLEVDFQDFANVVFNSDNGLILDNAGQSAAIAGMGDGVNLFGNTSATADIDITNGSVLNAFDDMTDAVMIMGGAVGSVTIDPTTATGAGDNGLEFEVDGGTFNFTLGSPMGPDPDSPISTAMDPVGNNGVIGTIDNGGLVNLNFNNSDITSDGSSTGDGINVTGMNASTLNLNLNNSDVEGWSNGSGLELMAMSGSTFNVDGNNTSFDDAGDFGIDAQALSGSTLSINLDTFSADNAGTGGINLVADGAGSSIIGSTFTNGTTQNSGSMGMDGSFGISVTATNGGEVGDSGAMSSGITFSNVDSGNTDFMALTQDNGLIVDVDDDAFVSMIFDDVNMNANEFDGVIVNVNEPDASMDDGSFANLAFINGSEINNNGGNGFTLNATNGDNPMPMTPTAGIELLLMDSFVNGNANSFMQPVDPMAVPDPGNDPDEIGFGVVANADNNIITVNFDNTDLDDNEEGSALANPTNGGIVNFNFANMTIFDPVQICADSGGFASTMLTNVIIENITGDNAAISMHAETGGTAQGIFNNVTIRDVEAQAFAFLAETGGTVIADFNGLTVERAAQGPATMDTKTGLMVEAVLQGRVETGGMADIDYGNVNISDDDMTDTPVNAIQTNVVTAGILDLQIDGLVVTDTTAMAGEGEVETTVDGAGSLATIDFNNINVDGSDGRGINLESTGGGTFSFTQLNNISAQNAQEEGFNLTGALEDNGMAMTPTVVSLTNSNFNGAGQGGVDDGVNIDLSVSGDTQIDITGVTADNATFRGLDINVTGIPSMNNVDVNITGNSSFDNAGISDGIDIDFAGAADSTGTVTISDTTATGATGFTADGIEIAGVGTDVTSIALTNVDVSGAEDNGLDLFLGTQTNAANIMIDGLTANDTGGRAVLLNLIDIDGDSSISLANVTADNTDPMTFTGGGILIDLDNVTNSGGAGMQSISLDNVSAQNAQGVDGLNIVVDMMADTDDDIDVSITGMGGMNNFSGADLDGINIDLTGMAGTTGSVHVEDVLATGVGLIGVDVNVMGGITVDMGSSFNNITATGAGEEGLEISSDAASTITAIRGMNNNFDDAGQSGAFDGILLDIGAQATAIDIEFTDTTANNATLGGVNIDLASIGGDSSITLSNVDAVGSQMADGLNIDATLAAMANLDVAINGGAMMGGVSDFSDSAGDGVDIDIVGDGTNTIGLSVNGVTANDNGMGMLGGDGFNFETTNGENVLINDFANLTTNDNFLDGIVLSFDMGSAVTVSPMGTFENISSTGNQRNGMRIDVAAGSTIAPIMIDGLDLSDNGQAGADFDGLDIQVHGTGSAADFTFNNLTVNNSGGRGVDLDVYDDADLTVNIDGGAIGMSGLQGLDINVGRFDENGMAPVDSTGRFIGVFNDLAITDSGQAAAFTGDGVNLFVTGDGTMDSSTADVTFDNVDSTGSDEDGFDIDILEGANAIVRVQNGSSGSNNAMGVGFDFFATGMTTTASLLMDDMLAINEFNNNGMQGALITLEDGVTVPDLEVFATASGNMGNGIEIDATDGSGVTITNLDIAGAQADNNTGSGLVVNLNAVLGITDFSLTDATFTGNGGDQVFLGFDSMMLTDLMINNVDVTGNAMSEDGLEISLNDTMVTTLGITDLVATNNGQNGLNLNLSESALDGATTTSIGTGFITGSQFTGNAAQFDRSDAPTANDNFAGALISLTDDSTADFDIYENPNGFINNLGIGLNIQIMERADFALDDTNATVPGAGSFYANDIIGNAGFGMLVEANEVLDPDAMGPTYELVLGDAGFDPNVIMNNRDAAIALIAGGDSVGSFEILNSLLTNTLDGAGGGDPNFAGDGLAIRLEDDAELESLDIDGTAAGLNFNNNAGSGIVTQIFDDSRLGTMTNMTVLNTMITGNTLHGIDIQRNDNALYGATPMTDMIIIGATGMGNTFSMNGENGVNITNSNMAGGPDPLDLDITDNNFIANSNGILLTGLGNAQFTGNISDNDFMNQTANGIRVTLENEAALGDPNDMSGYPLMASDSLATQTLPTATPFLMDGNQILGSTNNGIFFDTNLTNGQGLNAGGAHVNVLIRDSLNDGTRTLISGNSDNGIFISDHSDFANGMGASMNTYAVIASDISNNSDDGINLFKGQNGAGSHAGVSLIVGNPDADLINPLIGNMDVIISENGDDGIDIDLTDGDTNQNEFSINRTTIIENGMSGDGTRALTNVGHGIEASVRTAGNLIANFENLDVLENSGDGMDFNLTTDRSGTVATITMHAVESIDNLERGLDVFVAHDRAQAAPSSSFFFIGSEARATDPTAINRFNSNLREGIVFDLRADSISQNVVNINGVTGVQTDTNPDLFVETNLGLQGNTLQFRPNTNHALVSGGSVGGGAVPETNIHFTSTVRLINNEIANNGGLGGFEDGVDFAVSALTRLNATIANNTFGGNIGDDIRIYPQRPTSDGGTDLNAPNSVNTNGMINGMPQTRLVYDPVAYVDLVFGSIDTNADGIPDMTLGNGRAAMGGTGSGNQITVNTFGNAQTAQSTNDGLWDNADPIKGPEPRPVVLAGQVQIDGIFDDETVNDFFENGMQQMIDPLFDGLWLQQPATMWPEAIFPPF